MCKVAILRIKKSELSQNDQNQKVWEHENKVKNRIKLKNEDVTPGFGTKTIYRLSKFVKLSILRIKKKTNLIISELSQNVRELKYVFD